MTPTELIILGRNDIRSDKFGAAAISYIYKAFDNFVASKEMWPFSEKLNMEWQEPKGFEEDCNIAINFIEKAIAQYNYELNNDSTTETKVNNSNSNILKLKQMVKSVQNNLENIETTIKTVNNTTDNTFSNIIDITKDEQ